MRLFVALRLDPATHAAVEEVQARLRDADRRNQVRWVDPSGIHLTFKFLGEVPEPRVPEIVAAVGGAVAGRRAPRLALAGVGGFPNLRRARVVWLGLEESGEALVDVHVALDAAMAPLGWEPEKRAFQPHLTLGRAREESRGRPQPLDPRLVRALEITGPSGGVARLQDRIALVRSRLSPAGARYEDQREWRLDAD